MEDSEISSLLSGMGDIDLGPIDLFAGSFEKENTFCRTIDRKGAQEDTPRDEQMQKLQAFLDDSPELANCSSDYDLRYMSALERAVDNLDVELVPSGARPRARLLPPPARTRRVRQTRLPCCELALGVEYDSLVDVTSVAAVLQTRGDNQLYIRSVHSLQ